MKGRQLISEPQTHLFLNELPGGYQRYHVRVAQRIVDKISKTHPLSTFQDFCNAIEAHRQDAEFVVAYLSDRELAAWKAAEGDELDRLTH